jgi:osmotically-inducible protein OsmY
MRIRKLLSVGATCLVVLLLMTPALTAQQAPAKPGGVTVTIKVADQDLQAAVAEALRHNTFTFPYFIDVSVVDQKAELRGKVDTELAKARVEQIARQVEGVKAVDNHVTIDPNLFAKTDLDIYNDVKQEMVWSPLVPEQKIIVQVLDGVVTLHGEVKDLRAVQSATANAIQGGAKKVINKLTIKPNPNIILPSPWRSLR